MTRGRGPSAGRPSASGVRRTGDEFQDLVAWTAALRLSLPRPQYVKVEVEQNGVGNLDDVILRTADPAMVGDRFTQVKWATKESSYVDEEYLTVPPSDGRGRALLRKLYDSYVRLRDRETQGQFTMELFTNRVLDPDHPLLARVDGRDGFLMPEAGLASLGSNVGKAVTAWADCLAIDRRELLAMLSVLRFRTGRDFAGERDNTRTLMLAAGLHDDEAALDRALHAAGGWVRDGRRELDPDDVNAVIDNLGLRAGPPTATLLIDGIDHDPNPEAATVHLDWVATYAESAPALRRSPQRTGAWGAAQADLDRAASQIEAAGMHRVYLRGYFRQATAFATGARLPKSRGFELDYKQGTTTWSTDVSRAGGAMNADFTDVGMGTDLAIVVATAADAAQDVRAYVAEAGLPVTAMVVFRPTDGPHDAAVEGAGHAVRIAGEVRRTLRVYLGQHADVGRLHLFLAGPNGLAVMLGHRWNGLRPTIVYEHLGVGRGYVPAFTVDS